MAELSPLLSPNGVALDTAVYSRPVALVSAAFESGSHIMVWKTFGVFPVSTGPAWSPWNLCIVRANDSSSGIKVRKQHLYLQGIKTGGIGMS